MRSYVRTPVGTEWMMLEAEVSRTWLMGAEARTSPRTSGSPFQTRNSSIMRGRTRLS
jgi:hypothetical protein